ncbi:LOW QUALITY PROTEIN: hypothetical protein OSB04_031497 [Centaurea solstitialis]|uniref:Uncharacterized protein n=1 Tax=Centaurea solstitialis TaxID=347529 RepID=A0AA38SAU9_9ASTR|nr:LOW QUALITY PROTEIN: hypothetical protein OSB04_031497 [Centaurea solstitialis]
MDLGASLKNLYSGNVIASCLPLKNIKTIKVYVRCEKLHTLFPHNNSVGYKSRSTLPLIGERRIFKCQNLQLDKTIGDPNKLHIYTSINLFPHSFAVKKTHLFDPYRSNKVDAWGAFPAHIYHNKNLQDDLRLGGKTMGYHVLCNTDE